MGKLTFSIELAPRPGVTSDCFGLSAKDRLHREVWQQLAGQRRCVAPHGRFSPAAIHHTTAIHFDLVHDRSRLFGLCAAQWA